MEPEEATDNHRMEADYSFIKPTNRKRKPTDSLRNTLMKRITLYSTKPSFVLGLGPKMIRVENRISLRKLLRKLMRQQNWTEATGVLSMLLKGTLRDKSPINNRFKYLASMELLQRMEGDHIRPNRIKHIYDNWMRKIGSMKHWPIEDKFAVHVEFILFCLKEGNAEDAHQATLCLMQELESVNDPMSNMIIGLTFRHLWHSTIPEEMQWRDSLHFHSPPIPSDRMVLNSVGCSVSNSHEVDAPYQCNSDTSVMNDKLVLADCEMHTETSFDVDHKLQVKNHPQNFEPQDFYMSSAERNGNEVSFSDHGDHQHYVSIFSALEGLDPLLLPLQLPHSIENQENAISSGEFLNGYYKDAVKYLDHALNSNPPISAALLPLIQLLLIGGRVDKALDQLEKFCHNSNATLPFRLRAAIVEHFDHNNNILLSACYEQILKKDPTCCHSLGKLVDMHRIGYYSLESLLEMIGLHLDGKCAESDTWRELALCFLKLSQCEEDRVSVCSSGAGEHNLMSSFNVNHNLKFLTQKNSKNAWRLRCRWWLTLHFSHKILASEILVGNLELLTYKAACACHMYESNFKYVAEVYNLLQKQNDKDLFLFLKMQMQNPIGLHSKL